MLTFLPYIGDYENAMSMYEESAAMLSPRHVGEQRVRNLVILTQLVKFPGQATSPGIEMWKGFEWSLLQYHEAICNHWVESLAGPRDIGGEDSYYDIAHRLYFSSPMMGEQYQDPSWLEREDIRLSHQSNLVRIDPTYYTDKFPDATNDLPYIWPTQ